MADTITGTPYTAHAGERGGTPRRLQKILVVLIVLLSIALVFELVYHLVIAPRLTVSDIRINNGTEIADAELLAVAGISAGMMYFTVDTEELERKIEAVPEVRDARVELSFPNRLSLSVLPRRPLAWSTVQTDAGSKTVVFDSEGVVFSTGSRTGDDWMPAVSGLRFPEVRMGLAVPDLLGGFLESLETVRNEAPELFGLISEYRVFRRNEGAYDLVLYPMHYAVPVRVGETLDAALLEHIFMTLEMLRASDRLVGLAEIDFRSGEGVLRPKGDDRG